MVVVVRNYVGKLKKQGRLASGVPVVVVGIIVIDTFLVILEINKYCQMRYIISLVIN